MRVGIGYDVHRLEEGRPLILGGVTIPSPVGLLGHSDADVLTHAIMDALLGAVGKGDIGRHFPDTDPALEGVGSLFLLERVMAEVEAGGFVPVNVDTVIIAQAPKLAPLHGGHAGEAGPHFGPGTGPDQYQGDDNGRPGFHREGRGYCRPGGGAPAGKGLPLPLGRDLPCYRCRDIIR